MIAPALVLAVALTTGNGEPAANDARVGTSPCAAWRSERTPPPLIRVLLKAGRVVTVPFRLYVARVVASEWGSSPTELRRAGAIAVKQYAWSRVIRWSGRSSRGRCFHVHADTRDQIYRPGKVPSAEVWAAVYSTWRWTLRNRDGSLIHTGYRTGARGIRCAHDAGRRLLARSARRCALAGWSTTAILLRYYGHREPVLWFR